MIMIGGIPLVMFSYRRFFVQMAENRDDDHRSFAAGVQAAGMYCARRNK